MDLSLASVAREYRPGDPTPFAAGTAKGVNSKELFDRRNLLTGLLAGSKGFPALVALICRIGISVEDHSVIEIHFLSRF